MIVMLRPYLKFLIAGGVLSGEGGSMLASGLELIWSSRFIDSLSSISPYVPQMGSILTLEAIGYTIAGIVSLIIGLPLLSIGISRRKQYLATHAQEPAREIGRPGGRQNEPIKEQPYSPQSYSSRNGATRKYCTICGSALPNLVDLQYCPSCGHRI